MIPDFKIPNFFLPENLSLDEIKRYQNAEAANKEELLREQDRQRKMQIAEMQSSQQQTSDVQLHSLTDFDLIEPIDCWIENNCYDTRTVNPESLNVHQGRRVELTEKQRRILRHIFTPHGNRISRYTTVIWSEPKKSGKTGIAGMVVAYFAANVDPPTRVLIIANKKDQAKGRIYQSSLPHLKGLGADIQTSRNSVPEVRMPNGTVVKALPNDPATEAGDAYVLTAWSEIWGFKTEEDEKLYAELMPVDTMRVSMRWIETYAGYRDESTTLLRLYLKAFKDTDERELQDGLDGVHSKAQYVPELLDIRTDDRPACIEIPDEELFIFWSHERDMPWQSEQKRKIAEKDLPKTEYIRLIENRWQNSSSDLLEESWILASVKDNWTKQFEGRQITLAVDASQRHDSIALVGSFLENEIYHTPFVEIYDPQGQDANLQDLVENRVKALFDEGLLASYINDDNEEITPVYFDPWQLHQIRLNCIEYGIDVIEFDQGTMRAKADTMLYYAYRKMQIRNLQGREDFYEHLRAGKAKFMEGEQLRIIKGTTVDSKRIDALIGQSMSCYGAFLLSKMRLTIEDGSSLLLQGTAENNWFLGGGAKMKN